MDRAELLHGTYQYASVDTSVHQFKSGKGMPPRAVGWSAWGPTKGLGGKKRKLGGHDFGKNPNGWGMWNVK